MNLNQIYKSIVYLKQKKSLKENSYFTDNSNFKNWSSKLEKHISNNSWKVNSSNILSEQD